MVDMRNCMSHNASRMVDEEEKKTLSSITLRLLNDLAEIVKAEKLNSDINFKIKYKSIVENLEDLIGNDETWECCKKTSKKPHKHLTDLIHKSLLLRKKFMKI